MHPFTLGQRYHRDELLEFVGSKQQQSGIVWGPREPGCVICTSGGRHSKKAGYEDGPAKDGKWHYFGQGEIGDQDAGAFANKLLIDGDRTVLLFLAREPTVGEIKSRGNYKKQYQFVGDFHGGSFNFVTPSDGPRNGDRLIRFELLPVAEQSFPTTRDHAIDSPTLAMLREKAIRDARESTTRESVSTYRDRSLSVKFYALRRAEGRCEWCRKDAPFLNAEGSPFLEVHHILRLADDGPDLPTNVASLCPNCHRAAHFADNKLVLQISLVKRVLEIEAAVEQETQGKESTAAR